MPPEQLGAYLRDFDALLDRARLHGLPYGHFGDGCVHVRIDFPLTSAGGAARYRDLRRGGGRAGGRLRRVDVGRARRRPGPVRAAAGDVLPRRHSAVRQVKAAFDPDNLLNPGVLVDPRPVDADLRAAALVGPSADRFSAEVHRCPGVGKCLADTHRRSRRDVPVVPGHPRGEGLHPRPGPGAAGDDQRRAGPARLEVARRCTRPWICACPARDARGTARPGSTWRRTSRRCWTSTYARQAATAQPLRAGLAAALGAADHPGPAAGAMVNRPHRDAGAAAAGALERGRRSAALAAAVRAGRGAQRGRVATPTDRLAGERRWCVWVDSFSDCFTGGGVEAVVDVLQRGRLRAAVPGRDRLLRTDLDQHRSARRSPTAAAAAPGRAAPVRGRRDVPSSAWSRPALAVWRSDAAELLPDDPRVAEVGRRGADPRRAAGPYAGLVAARPDRASRSWPSRTATTPSVLGWQADAALLAAYRGDGDHRRRLLRAGRQLRGGEGPLRRVGARWPSTICCPPSPRTRTRSCWPTASPAAPSSPSSPARRPSRWPSCGSARVCSFAGARERSSSLPDDPVRARCSRTARQAPARTVRPGVARGRLVVTPTGRALLLLEPASYR